MANRDRIKGPRSGVTINVANVGKDNQGFDDVDDFWDASEVASRTSISTFASGSGRDPSSSSGDAVFDYEDSNSISEEEEEEEEVSTAEEIVDSPSVKSRKSPSKSPNNRNRDRETLDTALPFEDTLDTDIQGEGSPFNADAFSPVNNRRKSTMSPPAKMRIKSPSGSVGSGGRSGSDQKRGKSSSSISKSPPSTLEELEDVGTLGIGSKTLVVKSPRSPSKSKSKSPSKSSSIDSNNNNNNENDNDKNTMDVHVHNNNVSALTDDGHGFDDTVEVDGGGADMDMGYDDQPMDDYDDMQQGGRSEDEEEGDSKSRRVSFGQGTKEKDTSVGSSKKKKGQTKGGQGGPNSRKPQTQTNTHTPDSANNDTSRDYTDDADTPDSDRSVNRTNISTPGSSEFARGRKAVDETFEESEDEALHDTDSEAETSGYANDSFASAAGKKRKNYNNNNNKNYDSEGDSDDNFRGQRRSKRVTKGKNMAWWKGERPVYDAGRMIGLLTANPTPKKKSNNKTRGLTKDGKAIKVNKSLNYGSDDNDINNKSSASASEAEEELEEFENTSSNHQNQKRARIALSMAAVIKKEMPINLPENINFMNRNENADELNVWDDPTDDAKNLKVVCYGESLQPPSALPMTAERPEGKHKVGFAAQSFNVPEISGNSQSQNMSGWITGFVELPPGAIKDAEGVGECAQVFFISEAQNGSLELGIADPAEPEWRDEKAQRQLLNKGDSFYVPPGNIYRLENHSQDTSCFIFWTIVKPLTQTQTQSGDVAAGVAQPVIDADADAEDVSASASASNSVSVSLGLEADGGGGEDEDAMREETEVSAE